MSGDLEYLQQIFDRQVFEQRKVNKEFHDSWWKVQSLEVMRCLLENGAQAKDVYIPRLRDCHSLEKMKLLAEHGFNFKEEGYLILE